MFTTLAWFTNICFATDIAYIKKAKIIEIFIKMNNGSISLTSPDKLLCKGSNETGLKILFGSTTLTLNISLEKLIASFHYFSNKCKLVFIKENEIRVNLSCVGKKILDVLMKIVIEG